MTLTLNMTLIETFLTVADTGSFAVAAERPGRRVSASAVSLRIKRLEEIVGHQLFDRSKAGAEMTSAGREFEHYASSMMKLWAEARQQVALPDGYTASLSIGAQYSLWSRLGFAWIDRLRDVLPSLSIRAELGMPDRLTRFLVEGIIQVGLIYTPRMRPGLEYEELTKEELVMVAAWPDPALDDLRGRYAFVDWGSDFVREHAVRLPELASPGLTLSLGAVAEHYILSRGMAAYLPAQHAKPYLDSGELHLVPNAPCFPYPVWVVWHSDLDDALRSSSMAELRSVAAQGDRDQNEVLGQLDALRTDGGQRG